MERRGREMRGDMFLSLIICLVLGISAVPLSHRRRRETDFACEDGRFWNTDNQQCISCEICRSQPKTPECDRCKQKEIEPNYENTEDKDTSDEELDNKNYIEVIPDNLVRTVRVVENDRSSTGTIGEDYENLKENPSSDTNDGSSNYINVDPLEELIDDTEREENGDEDSSDYVNSSKCALRQ